MFSIQEVKKHTLKTARITRAINNNFREEILNLLSKEGKMTVSRIYKQLNCEQSVASQHLAILREAGLVKTTRDGKFVYYEVNTHTLTNLNNLCQQLNRVVAQA